MEGGTTATSSRILDAGNPSGTNHAREEPEGRMARGTPYVSRVPLLYCGIMVTVAQSLIAATAHGPASAAPLSVARAVKPRAELCFEIRPRPYFRPKRLRPALQRLQAAAGRRLEPGDERRPVTQAIEWAVTVTTIECTTTVTVATHHSFGVLLRRYMPSAQRSAKVHIAASLSVR